VFSGEDAQDEGNGQELIYNLDDDDESGGGDDEERGESAPDGKGPEAAGDTSVLRAGQQGSRDEMVDQDDDLDGQETTRGNKNNSQND